MKTTIDYNAIQKEIHKNLPHLKSGAIDVYDFTARISGKYFEPVDKIWAERTNEANPYLDLLFAMLEINGIKLY